MPDIPLPIANGFYKSDSLPVSAQECLNYYPNLVQTEGLNREICFGTPGLDQLVTTGSTSQSINRGSHRLGDTAYEVNGNSLVRVNSDFTTDIRGTITGSGRVSMADNGSQLMILVPGGDGFIFTQNPDSFATITDPGFTANGAPQHVVYIDGFFCCTTDTKKFIISALNNGLAYDSSDFGTAEADPDKIVAPVVFLNQLWIGGSETFEQFSNQGGTDFPFLKTGLIYQKGVFSAFSLINSNNTFMWIGGGKEESPAVWQSGGNFPEKVSDTGIDTLLERTTQTELEESFAVSYAQSGAYFVGFSLPDTTIFINTINGRWHERKSVILRPDGVVEIVRWRVNSIVSAYGKLLVGDSQDGRIGSMDVDVFQEYGEPMFRRIATQPFQNNMNSFSVPSLELTVESGTGNANSPEPIMRLDRSLDGKKFTYERQRKIGRIGESEKRLVWTRNGRARRFEVFRFTTTSSSKSVIIQLTADIRGNSK